MFFRILLNLNYIWNIHIKLLLLVILQLDFILLLLVFLKKNFKQLIFFKKDVSGRVRIWDTINKEHILKIELQIISGPIYDLQWSDDSKRIVAVGEGREKYKY